MKNRNSGFCFQNKKQILPNYEEDMCTKAAFEDIW